MYVAIDGLYVYTTFHCHHCIGCLIQIALYYNVWPEAIETESKFNKHFNMTLHILPPESSSDLVSYACCIK